MLIQFLAFSLHQNAEKERKNDERDGGKKKKIVKRIFILRNRKRLWKSKKIHEEGKFISWNNLSKSFIVSLGNKTSEVKLNQATTCVKLKINQRKKIFLRTVRDGCLKFSQVEKPKKERKVFENDRKGSNCEISFERKTKENLSKCFKLNHFQKILHIFFFRSQLATELNHQLLLLSPFFRHFPKLKNGKNHLLIVSGIRFFFSFIDVWLYCILNGEMRQKHDTNFT